MAKMKIFSTPEQNNFESPPIFNSVERKRFFTLPLTLQESVHDLKTPTNKVCFLVAAGYFKARHRFFARQFHQNDIEFVAKQIGINIDEVQLKTYSRVTYLRHQSLILNYFGFSSFDMKARVFAKAEIATMTQVQFRPKLILLEIIQVLTREKISLPSYNVLSTLIINAINHHQSSLNDIIKERISDTQKKVMLDALLQKITGTGSEDKWRYQLTLLKKASQSIKPGKIKDNITDLNELMVLNTEFNSIIMHLALSYECLRYYASSVIKSQIHQISRRATDDRYLHLIAFVVYQSLKLQDVLIDTLLLSVKATINGAEKDHKECYYEEKEARNLSVSHLVDELKTGILGTIATIKIIIADPELTAEQKVVAIDTTVNHSGKEKNTVEKQINDFKKNITAIQKSNDYYDMLENRSVKLQNRVADIVRYTNFDLNCGKPLLLEAILHYQKKVGDVDKSAPMTFLTEEQQSLMFDKDKKFRVSLYKALLYIGIFDAIKSGVLNVIHSEKYRSLEDYLIPKSDWNERHDEYLQRAQLSEHSDCKATLASLDEEMESRYKETNERFIEGKNPLLKFRLNGTFHVTTPKLEEVEALALSGIFPERKYIPLLEGLSTVDAATDYLGEFEHWQMKHKQIKPAKKVFFAGIMAYGCDIEHHKFAQISKEINENELDNTLNWYFSLPNVQGANDRVLQFMDNMEIPNIYRNKSGLLHTSDDGQKYGVSVDSLNSNYSFKYLCSSGKAWD